MTAALPALAALLLAAEPPATLTEFLESARAHNHTIGISRAQLEQQDAAVRQALASLTPTVQLTAGYTRYQSNAVLTISGTGPGGSPKSITIQPYDSLTGTAGVTVPILALQNLYRYQGSKHGHEAAAQAERASEAEVLLSTAQAYYQIVGSQGVLDAAQTAVRTAGDNLQVTQTRLDAGSETRLAVDRARTDLARANQTLASAQQTLALAVRNLETLSGRPVDQRLPALGEAETVTGTEDDYVREAEERRPELAQARATIQQQEASVKEAWAGLVPSVSANAQEHYTNAPGFIAKETYWTAGVNLTWILDPVGNPANIQHARAAVDEQQQRFLQQQDSVRDDVHSSWLSVEATRARLEEAVAEAKSTDEALTITRVQYREGTATSLEVSQAQRDAFNAQATLAQTRADLAAAVLSLRKAAGEPLLPDRGQP